MTVHMFRAYIGEPDDPAQTSADVEDWVSSNDPWTDDSVAHELVETAEGYYVVNVRFEQTDTKANLLQKLADKIENKCQWYRVGYHACTHDEENAHACEWDDRDEWTAKDVTVPSTVPNFN